MANSNISQAELEPIKKSFFKDVLRRKFRLWLTLYLFVFPTLGSLLLFNYYPNIDAFVKSFFRWNPPSILEFVGFGNYQDAFADQRFWRSFALVGILLAFNFVKLIPGILTAIALHRLYNDKVRYFFQVLFVVPMIIPAMVWLLVWKSFYDPDFGLLNRTLNATGLMNFLDFLDVAMPAIAGFLEPVFNFAIDPLFGSVAGLILFGAFVSAMGFWHDYGNSRIKPLGLLFVFVTLFPLSFLVLGFEYGTLLGIVAAFPLIYFLNKLIFDKWVIWLFLALGGLVVFWGELWRMPLLLLVSYGAFEFIRQRNDFFTGGPKLRWMGFGIIALGVILVFFGKIWTFSLGQFQEGTPAWLGHPDLVVPALVFWGFPWVGTVGVLIYLSGLQNISQDVYEAAELDGVSPLGMILRIELPLIMTQVRINIIFMTIGTLTMYEMFFILLGVDGGPDGRGMVPGLYMFREAFTDGRFGYACALGMILFVIILCLTIIYQKYVKVDK